MIFKLEGDMENYVCVDLSCQMRSPHRLTPILIHAARLEISGQKTSSLLTYSLMNDVGQVGADNRNVNAQLASHSRRVRDGWRHKQHGWCYAEESSQGCRRRHRVRSLYNFLGGRVAKEANDSAREFSINNRTFFWHRANEQLQDMVVSNCLVVSLALVL
jgi:hypothetical protein